MGWGGPDSSFGELHSLMMSWQFPFRDAQQSSKWAGVDIACKNVARTGEPRPALPYERDPSRGRSFCRKLLSEVPLVAVSQGPSLAPGPSRAGLA